jgi:hypothetical protein
MRRKSHSPWIIIVPVLTLLNVTIGTIIVGCVTPPVDNARLIPAVNQRVAIQSQCAQNVIECTTSWPTAVATVVAGPDQTVTANSNSFVVVDPNGWGGVEVNFKGSDSIAGNTATMLAYRWSHSATDTDPCTLQEGTFASAKADPQLLLATGFHYIRLRVVNDVIRDQVVSDTCGVVGEDTGSFDFIELEVEVRNN